MSKKTIYLEDAINALHTEIVKRRISEDVNDDGSLDEFDTESILRRLPPAQPETHDKRTKTHACDYISRRPKGHWIFDFAHNEMTCSECGLTFTGGFDLENADNFCRHCGSDNRGEQT